MKKRKSASAARSIAESPHRSANMEYRPFGRTGRKVPIIGQGTWEIDTTVGQQASAAEIYGDAEKMIGGAIRGRRDDVFLMSKVLPENASFSGTKTACERSLVKLGTHYLDLQERAIEHRVIPWCEAHNVAAVGYSPSGHGNFPQPNTPGARILQKIADAREATPRQVALAFLTRQPPLFTIPKTGNPEHAAENAGAGALKLTEDEIARIDAAFPLGQLPAELPVI